MVANGCFNGSLSRVVILLATTWLLALGVLDSAAGEVGKSSADPYGFQDAGGGGFAEGGAHGVAPMETLREILIPRNTMLFFNDLYARRQKEIHSIIDQNPDLIWPAIGLFLDVLPALRAVPENGGKLCVDWRMYQRANELLIQCEKRASPGLNDDLKKMRAYIDGRTVREEGKRAIIDLN